MPQTCTVVLKERNERLHRFEQATSVNLQDDHYAIIECLNGSQFIFNHSNVLEIEVQQNKGE